MAGSSVIGALRVNLGLDMAQFSTGIKQAQTRVGAFANNLNKRLGKLGNLPGVRSLQVALADIGKNAGAAFGAMGATATLALGAMSVSAISTAKELQNLSRISNATPEEFQKMAYGASQYGISQEKLSDQLKDFNDRIGDFVATGGGPMADFFERIGPKVGVTADDFRKLSGPQAMQLYVDSLEKANLNQQDFTFFMEAMASDATALIPLLKNGGKQAQAYGERLVALGAVMSNGTVNRLAGMKSALTDIGVVLGGLKNQFGAAFAPLISSLAGVFTDLLSKGSLLRGIFDGISAAVGWLADVLAACVDIISAVVSGIWSVVKAGGSWINTTTGIGDAIKTIWDWTLGWVGDILIGTAQAIKGLGGIGGAFWAIVDIAAETWERIKKGLNAIENYFLGAGYGMAAAFTGAFGLILTAFASLTDGIASGWNTLMGSLGIESNARGLGVETAAAVMGQADSLRKTSSALFQSGNNDLAAALAPLESVAAVNARIAASAEEAGGALGREGEGLDKLADKAGGGKEKLTKFQEVMKALNEEAAKLKATFSMTDLDAAIWEKQREAGVEAGSVQGQQIAGTMTLIDKMQRLKDATAQWRDTMKSAFTSLVTGASSFKETLSSIIMKLAEMVANSAFDALFSGMGGGGGILGALGGIFGGFRANGGGVSAGKSYVVGERGPEVFTPGASGMITPNHALGGGAGVIKVEAVPNPYFDVRVSQISQHGDRMAAAAGRRAMPGAIQEAQRRGTR